MAPLNPPKQSTASPSANKNARQEDTPPSPLDAANSFVSAMKILNSNLGVEQLVDVLDQVPVLKRELEAKEREMKSQNANLETLRAEHDVDDMKSLNKYNRSLEMVNKEKAALQNEVSSLQAKIEHQERLTQAHKDDDLNLQTQINRLKEEVKSAKNDLKKARNEVDELGTDLKLGDARIKQLQSNVKQEQTKSSQLSKKSKDLQAEKSSLNEKLETFEKRVSELEGFAVPLHDERPEPLIERLESLWAEAYQLVESYFQADLANAVLQNAEVWRTLRDPRILQHQLPLPQTNTTVAKQMRIAVILTILARKIDELIFDPTYILHEKSGLRELLLHEAVIHSQKESYCRALLLAMFPEEQAKVAAERVTIVVDDTMMIVNHLLTASEAADFRSSLKELVQHASDAWLSIQRLQVKVQPSFKLTHSEKWDWQMLRFRIGAANDAEQNQVTVAEGEDDEALLVIVPRIYIAKDSHPDPRTSGVVLRRSQSRAAMKELAEGEQINFPFGRAMSNRPKSQRRNLPISVIENRNGIEARSFLPQSAGR